ncbi:MAG: DUF2029 domain-containing protein [Chloroflexi bacterium]|nr:DUF2029 domain-containing protein [Chloroflexota bacterium]
MNRRWATLLPVFAIATFAVVTLGILSAAVNAGTFGYDFEAYRGAATRALAGQPLYDPSVGQAGGFALFLYPPPFVLGMLPFGVLPADLGSWVWLILTVAMLVAGIWLLPVGARVRWSILLLAGLSWPVAYAFKLGQVGSLLLLLFSAGWRWQDRPGRLGLVGAIGAIVKIQPGIVLLWALLTGRWRAAVIGSAVLVTAAVVSTLLFGGPGIWLDYITLLRNVNDPISTPHNFTVGAVAFQMGASEAAAGALQVASSAVVAGLVVLTALRSSATTSYLVAVVGSQLLSPVLWDHYAMLLLLPIAALLDRGWWWTVAIPLATSVLVLPFGLPPILYPVAFGLTLAALIASDRRAARPASAPGPVIAAAA